MSSRRADCHSEWRTIPYGLSASCVARIHISEVDCSLLLRYGGMKCLRDDIDRQAYHVLEQSIRNADLALPFNIKLFSELSQSHH